MLILHISFDCAVTQQTSNISQAEDSHVKWSRMLFGKFELNLNGVQSGRGPSCN